MEKNTQKPFVFQLNDIFKYKILTLTPFEKLILMAISSYCSPNGVAEIYLIQIAHYVGIKKCNVKRYLEQLRKRGILSIKSQFKRGKKCMTKSLYKININAIIDLCLDEKGQPIIRGTHQVEVTFDQIEDTKCDRGVFTANTGCIHSEYVKNRSINLKLEPKDIAHQDEHDKKISKLTQPCRFDEFWAIYPRKQDKVKAKKAWDRMKLDSQADRIIEDILVRRSSDVQWENKEFIPYGASYLNGERWNDEIIEANKGNLKHEADRQHRRLSKSSESVLRGIREYEESEKRRRCIS